MIDPAVTVVIPTYNRRAILQETLTALLAGQRGTLPAFEVVVVDDGASDDTPTYLAHLAAKEPRLTFERQANAGPGAARNRGLARARGELLLLLGDDTPPTPHWLHHHWGAYNALDRPRYYSALGHIHWHPAIPVTPFRHWIHFDGIQFGFGRIEDPEKLPFALCYTANLALSRALVADWGGFEPRFRHYGLEDTELGYRYQCKARVTLRYLLGAAVYHRHGLDIQSVCRRRTQVGRSAWTLVHCHPELASFVKLDHYRRHRPWLRTLVGLEGAMLGLAAALDGLDRRGIDVNFAARWLLRLGYAIGLARGEAHAP